jgi:oligoribonuclease NrnB/cAMP/cGMP phosphodiesterase (DHH superfamily)
MIVSITHEHDLDGIGSQAIIKRHLELLSEPLQTEICYKFATYVDFVEIIRRILDSDKIPSQLIISDIGFNESFEELFKYFETATTRGCKISWFDHHIVDDLIKERLRNLIHTYVNDPERCAAEVVKEYYLPNDDISNNIAKFARDTDFRTELFEIASNFQSIISFNRGTHNDHNKHRIVELLSQGDFENGWFSSQLKSLKTWLEEESSFAIENAIIIPLESFGEVVISWAKLGGGKITKVVKQEFPRAKAFFGIDSRHNEIIIHSDFLNCREFARDFKGGGHKERAGFKYSRIFDKPNMLTQSFLDEIKKNILKQI